MKKIHLSSFLFIIGLTFLLTGNKISNYIITKTGWCLPQNPSTDIVFQCYNDFYIYKIRIGLLLLLISVILFYFNFKDRK